MVSSFFYVVIQCQMLLWNPSRCKGNLYSRSFGSVATAKLFELYIITQYYTETYTDSSEEGTI